MKDQVRLEKPIAMISEGDTVMAGGLMGVGSPQRLIGELVRQRRGGLTLISKDTVTPGVLVHRLVGRERSDPHSPSRGPA